PGAPDAEVAGLADQIATAVAGQGVTRTLLVGYGPAASVTRTVLPAAAALRAHGIGVGELLRVADGRFWSYLCGSAACCPPEGTPFDVVATEVAAAATYAGRVAPADRAAPTAALAAPDGAALAAASAAAERAASSPRAAAAAGAGARRLAGRRALDVALCRYREGHCLDDDELARLVLP